MTNDDEILDIKTYLYEQYQRQDTLPPDFALKLHKKIHSYPRGSVSDGVFSVPLLSFGALVTAIISYEKFESFFGSILQKNYDFDLTLKALIIFLFLSFFSVLNDHAATRS